MHKYSFSLLLALLLLGIFPLTIYGQYLSDKGVVDTFLVISELKSLPKDSDEFRQKKGQIATSMAFEKRDHQLGFSNEAKVRILNFIDLLVSYDPSVLWEKKVIVEKIPDIVDSRAFEIVALIRKNERINDSLNLLLVDFLEDEKATRATKELSVRALAQSNELKHIGYIMKNQDKLKFYDWSKHKSINYALDYEIDDFSIFRTGFRALNGEKIGFFGKKPLERNWSTFPFLIEYMDDSAEANSGESYFYIERIVLGSLIEGYNYPWLLLEFMYRNMDNKDSAIINMLKDVIEEEKEKTRRKILKNNE